MLDSGGFEDCDGEDNCTRHMTKLYNLQQDLMFEFIYTCRCWSTSTFVQTNVTVQTSLLMLSNFEMPFV